MMTRHRYPIRANLKNSFYFIIERVLRILPTSILMAMIFLLVGFSAATGFLIKNHDAHSETINKFNEKATIENRFALAAGTSLHGKDFGEQQKIAEQLGLPFHMKVEDKRVTMTRLYLGSFPITTGNIVLEKLKSISPGAFAVKQGQTFSVYGGSFYYPEKATKLKKVLIEQGYSVKEIPTRMALPVYSAFIGDFETYNEADSFQKNSAILSSKQMKIVEIS